MATIFRISCGWLVTLALVVLAAPDPAPAQEKTYSGTIEAIDRSAGTIVLDEVGPWKTKNGETVITPRTIKVTPETQFARVARGTEAGPTGWLGDFVESALPAWEIKPGDFVTITVKSDGGQATATRIVVTETGKP